MIHKFDKAKVIRDHNGQNWLCLRVLNAPMARQECSLLKKGKTYISEIKLLIERRSKKANNYFWLMCGKLAAVSGITKSEIYRSYILEIGDNYRMEPYYSEVQRQFLWKLWESQGLGWIAQDAGDNYLCLYYGSSTYDKKQMARPIDLLVQDCQAQGIETAPPGSIEKWIYDWKPDERTI